MQTTATDHRDAKQAAAPRSAQATRALHTAQTRRLARASRKRRLATASSARAARQLAAEWIADPPDELHTIELEELLLSCRGVGRALCAQLLDDAGLHGAQKLGDGTPRYGAITPRQQRVLIGVLLGGSDTVAMAA